MGNEQAMSIGSVTAVPMGMSSRLNHPSSRSSIYSPQNAMAAFAPVALLINVQSLMNMRTGWLIPEQGSGARPHSAVAEDGNRHIGDESTHPAEDGSSLLARF